MKTSEQIDKLAEALAAAQGEFEEAVMTGKNPHFNSKYAKQGDIKKATKVALSKYGLAFIQSPSAREGRAVVISRIIHKSGQWIEDELSLKPERGDTPQAIGSAITYARRYQKAAMLDVEGEEDDDGEAAEGRGGKSQQQGKKQDQGRQSKHNQEEKKKDERVTFDPSAKNQADFLKNVLNSMGIGEKYEQVSVMLKGRVLDDLNIVLKTLKDKEEAAALELNI